MQSVAKENQLSFFDFIILHGIVLPVLPCILRMFLMGPNIFLSLVLAFRVLTSQVHVSNLLIDRFLFSGADYYIINLFAS